MKEWGAVKCRELPGIMNILKKPSEAIVKIVRIMWGIACSNHRHLCEVKVYCDDFTQGSQNRPNMRDEIKGKEQVPFKKEPSSSERQVQEKPSIIEGVVAPGDHIVIEDCQTGEHISLSISDPKNPFVGTGRA